MKKKNKTIFTNTIKYNHSYISIIKIDSNTSIYINSNTSISSIPLFTSSSSSSSSIIYVTDNESNLNCRETPYNIGCTKDLYELTIDEINTRFAPIFIKANSIMIPKKAEVNLKRYVSKKDLRKIHNDMSIAIEMCLLFLSNLSSTYYTDEKWKSLNSTLLNNQFKWKSDNTYVYPKIKKVLLKGTKNTGPVIEIKENEIGSESYKIGETSKQFRLTSTYLKPGLIEYIIKDESLIKKRREFILNNIKKISSNIICRNLLIFYERITLPTKDEMLEKARGLVKEGHKTNKQKTLTFRNKHSNSHWKDYKERSFVEDNIELFEYLTKRGYMIPIPGKEKAGGRVVDSFTLMPSWIRKLCKIDGKPIAEVDYSTLHPNIALQIYRGSTKHINHDIVAEYLGISRQEAKLEHLSFFNKPRDDMMQSPLFKYYKVKEPDMLLNIYYDKDTNERAHKITSQRLFQIEVKIMTQVIKELNNMNIYVGYVYDALICQPIDQSVVKKIMNKVVKEFGVNTHV